MRCGHDGRKKRKLPGVQLKVALHDSWRLEKGDRTLKIAVKCK